MIISSRGGFRHTSTRRSRPATTLTPSPHRPARSAVLIGRWDPLYEVDDPALARVAVERSVERLNGDLHVHEVAGDIVVKNRPRLIQFGAAKACWPGSFNVLRAPMQNLDGELVVLAPRGGSSRRGF